MLARREELRESIRDRASNAADTDTQRLVEDMDQATESTVQTVSFRVMDKEVKLLKEVERALQKFDTGEYGLCEGTGEPVGFRRLKVVPWTRYSVIYKEQRESKQRQISGRLAGR